MGDLTLLVLISLLLFPTEPTIGPERAIQLTEWLKNNIWPPAQVAQYMLETAIHRATWIRSNGTIPLQQIFAEFPRLLDTPGMVRLHLIDLGSVKHSTAISHV